MMLKKYGFCTGTLLVGEIVFNISCGAPARPETCLDSHLRAWLNVEKSGWIFFTIMLKKYGFCTGTLLVGDFFFNISCGAPAVRPETCLDSHLRAWLNVEKSGWIFFTIMLKKYGFCTGTLLVGEIVFNISCGAPAVRPETCLDSHLRAWLNVEKSGWIFSP